MAEKDTSSQNELQRCGSAYRNIVKNKIKYNMKLFPSPQNMTEVKLQFTPSEFKHLAGLGKFKDLKINKNNDSSTTIYEKVNNTYEDSTGNIKSLTLADIVVSEHFFDDINEENNHGKNLKEPYIKKSDFLSRLYALENLYTTISEMLKNGEVELKIYKWVRGDKEEDKYKRPHNSKIDADYLLEFYSPENTGKSYIDSKPFIDFFIIENKGTYSGVSIFRSDVTFSDDTEQEKTELKERARKIAERYGRQISSPSRKVQEIKEFCIFEQEKTEIISKGNISQLESDARKYQKSQVNNERINKIISKFKNLRVEASKGKLFQYMKELHNIFRNDIADLKEISDKLEITESNRKEIAECISYERSELKKMIELKEKISGLENERTQFVNDSSNSYEEQIKAILDFLKKSAGKALCEQVLDLLKSQKHSNNPENEWIDMEISEIDSIKSSKPEDNIKMIQLHNSDMHRFIPASAISDGTLAITQNPFMTALTSLTERFRTFVQNIADKIQEMIAGALKELPDADTTPSEQTPEHDEQNTESTSAPAPEKDITDDDEFIIRDVYSVFADSIGTQGYENYMAVVPADKLDFQIPFFYETEQVQITQELEQDIQVTVQEFKKKQAEYDDF